MSAFRDERLRTLGFLAPLWALFNRFRVVYDLSKGTWAQVPTLARLHPIEESPPCADRPKPDE